MIPQRILSFFHAGKSLPFRSMTYFNFLLEAALAGSILILVVLVLRRVFRRQIGSRLVYLAWALVAIRLLLPIAIPNPLMDEFRPTYSTDAGARPVADQIRVRYSDALSDISQQLTSGQETVSPIRRSLSTLTLELAAYTSYGWLGKAYLLGYAAGGLIVAGVFSTRHIRFRRRLKRNAVSTLEGQQLALYQELCKRLGVKELPVIYVDPLPSPCLVGVLKPVIALPLTLPPESLSEALLHELHHYKAKDPWWVLLRCVCCTVHWFNPLVWIAQRFVKMDCELACDERVAAKLNHEERLHYANTLVITAKQAYAPQAGVLATGMTMTGKRLKWRVNAILRMKAVQKAAAILVAVVLIVLTAAAFSTAESVEQTKRLTTDSSAFPFEATDVYPSPEVTFGEPVALSPLLSAAEAEAQAKRYLAALYPQDQAAIQGYRYQVQTFGQNGWEVIVWPPEGGDTPRYYMELKSSGRLVSLNRTDLFSNGDQRDNTPSVLPGNLKRVLLEYGRQAGGTVLQNTSFDLVTIRGDMETAQGRYVVCDLLAAGGSPAQSTLMTVQIAPAFQLVSMSILVDNDEESPPIEQGTQTLTYSKDASIHFDATFWGQTDNRYVLSPEAALTVQQAFDTAVDTMLERSGLSKEEFLALPLEYGYYDKSNFDGTISVWRFVWPVDPNEPMNRYWVDFTDMATPSNITISMPGEGLG
ncbi:MAG: M56 family metallopeptidase [Candidatus Limiplasma sp.]|nr:M56 family metallopeptidase [Candidatus Limiplasma sp.]